MIYVFVISVLSTQTLVQSQIDLGFDWIYLEIAWKIHGILCHQRSGNPGLVRWYLHCALTEADIFLVKSRTPWICI